MTDRITIVPLVIVGSVVLALADFSLFFFNPSIAFYTHNAFSIAVGGGLAWYGYKLIGKKAGSQAIHWVVVIIGLAMVIIHITKLFMGKVF